jgi:RNA polymerase sigma-70 factor (ECF subfamily)
VQDVLLTLHAMRHAYDPRRPFQPWLAGIARHRIADRARRRARLRAREQPIEPAHETFIPAGANEITDMCDAPAMLRAVASLPAGQRRAIELMKLREMSLQEASAVSGMSVAALKVATHRGLARLRTLLAGAAG